jgi:hypothetical protein
MADYLAAVTPLTFAPKDALETVAATGLPTQAASPSSVARFEKLMYAPQTAAPAGLPIDAGETSSLRHYVEKLSQHWDAGQVTLQRMTDRGEFNSRELVLAQIQMVNCALDMEVSSRCAGMFESGVQTLVQRGS